MKDGFIGTAAVTTEIRPADCEYNSEQIISAAKKAAEKAAVIVFPELCITGYTCGDLFLQQTLLDGAEKALGRIAAETADTDSIMIVGLPVRYGASLYNCGAVLYKGRILGIVPKKNIPNYGEYYEARHFTSGNNITGTAEITLCGQTVPFGGDMLFCCDEMPDLVIGVEICEDLWVTEPPSDKLAAAGASIICNLSAGDEVIGKAEYRRQLVLSQSARTAAGYVYAGAGFGESSQDMVFAGHNIIAENGRKVSESKLFTIGAVFGVIDISKLLSERRRMNTYTALPFPDGMRRVHFSMAVRETELTVKYPSAPFVPSAKNDLAERCEAILAIQASGLACRLKHINCKNAVIGLSGGLDSTLALIVTVHAFDMLGLDRRGILTVTMPCFGTTSRTKSNAHTLAECYNTEITEINITDSVRSHFKDIGHDESVHDVTYENSQARERTQVLMDLANKTGGIVIGTGDLSELALGWATYNGDHMSMYAVNASIPKTLVRYLVSYEAETGDEKTAAVLRDILDTPVSPELLPPDENGGIAQKTEDIVGPYELHDYFLYYMLRFGFPPSKIYRIALMSFEGRYDGETIKKWLKVFIRRFFSQQFKRSCIPDGPKVGTVTLSPRGDLRMPSDASSALWLKEAKEL